MTQRADTVDSADWARSAARPWRITAAIVVSLLVHVLLLSGPRWQWFVPQPPSPADAPATLTVRLLPAAPARLPAPPVPAPAKALPTTSRSKSARAKTPATAPATSPTPVLATPATGQPAQPSSAPADAPAQPRFDMAAALSTARSVANERDPAKANTAVGQIPDKPLQTESKLARDIGAAKRANCKDGVPGGLLAPIFLLMDKKDSGCKW